MIYTIVRKDGGGNIDAVISFDSITSVDEAWSATVTSQVVEYGFDITDNINIEAPTYKISAILSSYSLFNLDKELVWDGSSFVSGAVVGEESHLQARDLIRNVFKQRSVVTLIESKANSNNSNKTKKCEELRSAYFNDIDNCVITSLAFSHPESGTGAFYVNITLQKINMARIEIAELVGDEKVAAIKQLMKVYTPTTSSSSKKDGAIDPETGLPTGEEEELQDGKPTQGNAQRIRSEKEEEYGINNFNKHHDAMNRARQLMRETNQAYEVVPWGTGWKVVKGLTGNPLLQEVR